MSETPPPPSGDPDSTPPPPPPAGGAPYRGVPAGQPYGGQPPSYGGQPYGGQPYGGPPYGGPTGAPPPNYLVWAILSTLFCCLPLGVAAIVFASQVNSKYNVGDYAGAQDSSRKARNFSLWSTIAGVALWVVLVGLFVVLAIVADSTSTSTTF
jgi:hypothetical protein